MSKKWPTCAHRRHITTNKCLPENNMPLLPTNKHRGTPEPNRQALHALRLSLKHTHEPRRSCASLHHCRVSLQYFDFEAAQPRQFLQVSPGVRVRAVRLQRVSSRRSGNLRTQGINVLRYSCISSTMRGLVRIGQAKSVDNRALSIVF